MGQDQADHQPTATAVIADIHQGSRGNYGAPRVHAELRLGQDVRCGRKRVARLMRVTGLSGVAHRHKGGHTPLPGVHDDLVKRKFVADDEDLFNNGLSEVFGYTVFITCAASATLLAPATLGVSAAAITGCSVAAGAAGIVFNGYAFD